MFDMKDLLAEYEQTVHRIVPGAPGQFDPNTGVWVPGADPQEVPMQAAVLPMSNDDLQSNEGGRYTRENRKMYCHEPIKQGQVVKIDGKSWTVAGLKPYDHHANGLRIAILARAGGASE